MPRLKALYRCQECAYSAAKPMGQCPGCEAWNTMVEEVIEVKAAGVAAALAAATPKHALTDFSSEVVTLDKVSVVEDDRPPRASASWIVCWAAASSPAK